MPTSLRAREQVVRPPLVLLVLASAIFGAGAAPVAYLFAQALAATDAPGAILSWRIALLAANSLALAAVVAVGSLAIALPLAWITALTDVPLRRGLTAMCIAPLAVPCYVGASALIASTTSGGALHEIAKLITGSGTGPVRGFWAGAFVLTLFIYPLALLPIRAAMLRIDRAQVEAARSLGRGRLRTAMTVGAGQLAPAIGAGALLVVLYTLSEFGAVSLLRCRTFTSVIYVQYQTFNQQGAAVSALALIGVIVTLLALYELLPSQRGRVSRTARPLRIALGRWRWATVALPALVAAVSVGGVVISLVQWLLQSPAEAIGAFPWSAAFASLAVGAGAGLCAVTLACPIAILAARHRTRIVGMIERLSFVGFGVPGIVIALGLGALALHHAPPLYQTWALVIVAMVTLFLPQALGAIRTPLEQAPGRLEEAARSLGRSRAGAFVTVTLPIARPGLVAGALLVFISAAKELPATLLLSPAGSRTLATEVWRSSYEAMYAHAAPPALALIALSAITVWLVGPRGEVRG